MHGAPSCKLPHRHKVKNTPSWPPSVWQRRWTKGNEYVRKAAAHCHGLTYVIYYRVIYADSQEVK